MMAEDRRAIASSKSNSTSERAIAQPACSKSFSPGFVQLECRASLVSYSIPYKGMNLLFHPPMPPCR
jgi:hypothetical protein